MWITFIKLVLPVRIIPFLVQAHVWHEFWAQQKLTHIGLLVVGKYWISLSTQNPGLQLRLHVVTAVFAQWSFKLAHNWADEFVELFSIYLITLSECNQSCSTIFVGLEQAEMINLFRLKAFNCFYWVTERGEMGIEVCSLEHFTTVCNLY